MRRAYWLAVICICCGYVALGWAAERPNVLILFADDLGYGDLGCYGNTVMHTPNIDRLAREGVRFTSAYAGSPVCSPSRAALLTGRTPQRVGIHNWIAFGAPMYLPTSEVTLAEVLKEAGYQTCHVGKWHLNGSLVSDTQPDPYDHGFDHWFATQNNALPSHQNPVNFVRNGVPVGRIKGFSGLIVAEEVIRWLREDWDRRRPFFLYVCFHEPHEPIATAPHFQALFRRFPDPRQRRHHGNIAQLDYAVGRILKAIDEMGLREQTFVYFSSDNGPAITRAHPYGSAGPLRAKKAHLYEGGIRVPGILRWPGRARPGTECDEPVGVVDLLPTICAAAGIAPPRDRKLDGTNFLPVLDGKPLHRAVPLYWQLNSARSEPKVAMRVGDWKILGHLDRPAATLRGDIRPEDQDAIKHARLVRFELYNLKEDIGEQHDLASTRPDKLAELKAKLVALYREIQRETPTWPAWQRPR